MKPVSYNLQWVLQGPQSDGDTWAGQNTAPDSRSRISAVCSIQEGPMKSSRKDQEDEGPPSWTDQAAPPGEPSLPALRP